MSDNTKNNKQVTKQWWFWFLVIMLGLGIIFGADSDFETNNTIQTSANAINTAQENSQSEEIQKENTGEGDVGKYHVAIKDYSITYNNSNEAVLLVKIAFTNNNKEEKAFTYNLDAKAYQNGVELTTPISSYGIDGLDWNDKSKNIKPGVTYEFNMGYYLEDKNSDVEIEIIPYWGSTNSQKVTKTLHIKNN